MTGGHAAEVGIGVDVGSQGVRIIASTVDGTVLASARESWPLARDPAGAHEQDPERWWTVIQARLAEVVAGLPAVARTAPTAISVTATSGTVVVCDAGLRPLRPALMWDDKRAVAEARDCARAGADLCARLGYRFRPTFSLPKILWIRRNEPDVWRRVRYAAHATDWLAARLTEQAPISDYSNALKSGYDLIEERWPEFIDTLGIDSGRLPDVVPAGTVVGRVSSTVAGQIGLSRDTAVVAGMTDANSAQVASGAFGPGQWVTTIGTGLSLKGVSRDLIIDPRGVLYCHRHPDGYWIPSGTSHSGADAIATRFPEHRIEELTRLAADRPPGTAVVFPLPRRGEFFPFWAPEATGFTIGEVDDDVALFRACLEGIAYVERLSFDVVEGLGAAVSGPITTVGGGSRSALWRQIRADVLGRPVRTVANPETALGAAVVALSAAHGGIVATARHAVTHTGTVEPRAAEHDHYTGRYRRFTEELVARGYWEGAAQSARAPRSAGRGAT